MLRKNLDPRASIIHGAILFEPWSPIDHPLALVVSDYNEGYLNRFLMSVLRGQHSFREIVVMHSSSLDSDPVSNETRTLLQTRGIRIKSIQRESEYMDWCEARVESEWFMYTNTYFNVRRHADVLVNADGRSLVPFVEANSSHCLDYKSCASAIKGAKHFDVEAHEHVLDSDIVFHSVTRDQFCKSWFTSGLIPPTDRCVPQGPTATAYVAFLGSFGLKDKLYRLQDKSEFGSRTSFIQKAIPTDPDGCMGARRKLIENATDGGKQCIDFEDLDECTAAHCTWSLNFARCYNASTPVMSTSRPSTPPSVRPTSRPSLSPTLTSAAVVSIELMILAEAAPTESDLTAVKTAIEFQVGLVEGGVRIQSFQLVSARRRLGTNDDHNRIPVTDAVERGTILSRLRRLDIAWEISFAVLVDLSTYTTSSGAADEALLNLAIAFTGADFNEAVNKICSSAIISIH
jgi:hypothetical protein